MTELPVIAQLHLAVGTLSVVWEGAAMLPPKGSEYNMSHFACGKFYHFSELSSE